MRVKNRSPFHPMAQGKMYRIENKAKADEATIYIYDEISFWGVDAGQFVKDLGKLTAKTIRVRFNSPGGSVFDGIAMANAIRTHKSRVVAHIDGLAASIATIVAVAADEVLISEGAFMMIHGPWSIVMGDSDAMREEADLLDKVGGSIINAYVKKTGMKDSAIKELMQAETWMTAEEALDMGFADSLDENDEKKNSAKTEIFDLSVFGNVPDQLLVEDKAPTAREMEKALKDAGLSHKQAKEVLANGYKDGLRDDEPSEGSDPNVQRDVELDDQRDVDPPLPKTADSDPGVKDKTAELLTRAEVLAPTKKNKI